MVFLPSSRQAGPSFAKRDSGSSTQGVVIGVVIGVVALAIVAVVLWYFLRNRRPKRVKHVRSRPRLDDGDLPKQTFIEDFASAKMSMNGGRPGGIESWIQSTQLASGPATDFPRSPGRKAEETFVPPTPPSPPPASLRRAPRPSHDRSPSTHSLLAQAAASAPAPLPPAPASAPAAVGQTPESSHVRPLAFLKAVFSGPEDEEDEDITTPTVARLPLMPPPPTRPQRSPSLALTQSAYGTELTPADAPDSAAQRSPRRKRSLTSVSPPPLPSPPVPRSAALSGSHSRRQSFSAASSQGGLPLPSFYLPSDVGGERDQPAIPIGESVLGVSLERRPSQSSRRGRTRGSHFVVVNATEDD